MCCRLLRIVPILVLFPIEILNAQTSTFRAGTQEVQVDVSVTDKRGLFQRDLSESDFRLRVDGKEREITGFSVENTAAAGKRGQRYVALVFEVEHPGLREEVMQFVDKFAAPDVYMAVYARIGREMKLRLPFTSDPQRLKTALREMPAVALTGDVFASDPALVSGYPPHALPLLVRVSGVAAELAPIHGRKALLLFSYTMMGNRSPGAKYNGEVSKTISDCVAADVSVYAFAGGRRAGTSEGDYYDSAPDTASDKGGTADQTGDLAIHTGGRYMPPGKYELDSYLNSGREDGGGYYRLTFKPAEEAGGNPCHKLKVAVDRAGLDVRARDSYCASAPMSDHGLNAAQRVLQARLMSGKAGDIGGSMQLSWFYAARGEGLVDISMAIDWAAIKLKGKQGAEINVAGVALREDDSVAARFPDKVAVDFETAEVRDDAMKAPHRYAAQVALEPGRYRIRVAAGTGEGAVEIAEGTVQIEGWDGQTLSASGIALGIEDRPVTSVAAELNASSIDGPHALTSRGLETIPMAGAVFPRGRDGMFYFEVYEPRGEGKPVLRMRIVDRATGDEKADSGPASAAEWMRPGNAVIPVALTLPLATLAPGAYRLEVTAGHAGGGDRVLRTADFEVK